jgi:hypothetical protein
MPNSNDVDYPAEATIGDQGLRDAAGGSQIDLTMPWQAPANLHRRIARVAYEFYLKHGKLSGHDLDDWLEAERIVVSAFTQRQKQIGDHPNGKETQ